MRTDRTVPTAPLVLGAAGLIPFVALTLVIVLGWGPPASWRPDAFGTALATYGAIIASFLGGIRWGLALHEPERGTRDYVSSIVPSLLAWTALMLPRPLDLAGIGLVVLAWGFVDADLVRRGLAPAWFGRLRLLLSATAGAALLIAAVAA